MWLAWLRQRRDDPEHDRAEEAVREAHAQLAEARRERAGVERVTDELRRIRQANHLGPALRRALREQR